MFSISSSHTYPSPHSFPTRRSSDLTDGLITALALPVMLMLVFVYLFGGALNTGTTDRKSTRLNSSHPSTSYAVFCLIKFTLYVANGARRPLSTHAFLDMRSLAASPR